MTTPADELHTAARKLRAVAANATEGAWAIWRDLDHQGYITVGDAAGVIAPPELQSSGECNPVAHVYVEEDAEHIAAMHPGVGLALADWLDAAAEYYTPGPAHPTHVVHALVVARQVLGAAGEQPDVAQQPTAAGCACGVLRAGPGRHLPECPGEPDTDRPGTA